MQIGQNLQKEDISSKAFLPVPPRQNTNIVIIALKTLGFIITIK
jgi:hypothetical protein